MAKYSVVDQPNQQARKAARRGKRPARHIVGRDCSRWNSGGGDHSNTTGIGSNFSVHLARDCHNRTPSRRLVIGESAYRDFWTMH